MKKYNEARLIRMANAWKNRANYPSIWIIRAYFTLSNITLWRVVSWTAMQINQEVRMSEGQIIWAVLYILNLCENKWYISWCSNIYKAKVKSYILLHVLLDNIICNNNSVFKLKSKRKCHVRHTKSFFHSKILLLSARYCVALL